jgi:sugar phosphate isomerase/epimerase
MAGVAIVVLSTVAASGGAPDRTPDRTRDDRTRDAMGPAGFVGRAARLGVTSVALDAGLDGEALELLVPAILASGLTVALVEAPCPRQHPSQPATMQGSRPPRLASDDREERLAATRAFAATLETASRVGARLVAVQLGVLDVQHGWPRTVRAFTERTLDDDERERLVKLRRALSPHAIDLARFALDAILARAADAGVTVGLTNRARWFEIASAAEVELLLGEFRGAPLATLYDSAAAHVRAALGLGAGRPAIELDAAAGALLSDAAGLRGGLPWGTGEIDHAHILAKLPAAAPRILRSAIATDEEILQAMTMA